MNRTLNVVRLQLVNKMTYIWIPLIILVGALGLTLAIYAILSGSGVPGPFYGGGSQAPLWYFLVVGIQALTFSFPFSQAMSITRREFYLGTLLTAALTAAILSTVFVLGGFIEIATDGYGMNGYFFRIDWMWAAGMVGGLAGLLRDRDAHVRDRVLGGDDLQAVGHDRHHRSCSWAWARSWSAAMWLIGRLDAWAQVFAWFGAQGSARPDAVGRPADRVLAGRRT